jgi:hypothetical protein
MTMESVFYTTENQLKNSKGKRLRKWSKVRILFPSRLQVIFQNGKKIPVTTHTQLQYLGTTTLQSSLGSRLTFPLNGQVYEPKDLSSAFKSTGFVHRRGGNNLSGAPM